MTSDGVRMMLKSLPERESNKIRNMSFVCALFVASIHIVWESEVFGASWLCYHFLRDGVARIAVPYFFVVSGYFLGKRFYEDHWWRNACVKRFYSLFLPYVFWSVLYAFWTIPLSVAANIIGKRAVFENVGIDIPEFVKWFGLDLYDYPLLWPLWYVRLLMLLVIASPIFKWAIRNYALPVMLLAFLLMATRQYLPIDSGFWGYGISLSGIFYWMVGLCIALGKVKKLPEIDSRIPLSVGIGLLILRVWCYRYCPGFEPLLANLFVPFVLYAIWCIVSDVKWKSWITNASFPVYVMHPCWYAWVWVLGRNVNGLAKSLTMLFVGVFASIVFANAFRWLSPRICRVLFGGR